MTIEKISIWDNWYPQLSLALEVPQESGSAPQIKVLIRRTLLQKDISVLQGYKSNYLFSPFIHSWYDDPYQTTQSQTWHWRWWPTEQWMNEWMRIYKYYFFVSVILRVITSSVVNVAVTQRSLSARPLVNRRSHQLKTYNYINPNSSEEDFPSFLIINKVIKRGIFTL